MDSSSPTPELTPSRSPSPTPPIQPDHFYGIDGVPEPRSPDSSGRTWLDPDDDPLATRGIPVFKPSMDEFADFEGYINKIECWGMRSGIVKVIPPKAWRDALPPLNPQLLHARIKSPIEQHMLGRTGLFRQSNVEKRRDLSVREWAELCQKDEFRAPSVDDLGLRHASSGRPLGRKARRAAVKKEDGPAVVGPPAGAVAIKQEPGVEDALACAQLDAVNSPSSSTTPPAAPDVAPTPQSPAKTSPAKKKKRDTDPAEAEEEDGTKGKKKRVFPTREEREERLAERASKDAAFLTTFDAHADWLPPNTKTDDYTVDVCQKLERRYWRNQGLGPPAWYGADCSGSLFTEAVQAWNVAHLPSVLSRLLPADGQGLPGVNTPYLYFGMWRATFAWHVEDMDLFSINYIHFGAGKFWYACPQERAATLEHAMKSFFPSDISKCPQFLRHKSFLASPKLLNDSACRPNTLVQHAGEFVITFPHGYHAGFNLGFNCAESVNFALESWLDLGRKAKVCECVGDSVRIDVDELLKARERANDPDAKDKENKTPPTSNGAKKPNSPRKRKSEADADPSKKTKKAKLAGSSSSASAPGPSKVTLKLPKKPEHFPCCLCVSRSVEGLLRVHDPPPGAVHGGGKRWMAHRECASVVPETWVDALEVTAVHPETGATEVEREEVVFGVDGIVRDRWNLKCNACTKPRNRAHGAPVQCTKGKCSKAYHVSCAKASEDIVYEVVREVEKEVILVDGTGAVGGGGGGGESRKEEEEEEVGPEKMDVDQPQPVDPTLVAQPTQPVAGTEAPAGEVGGAGQPDAPAPAPSEGVDQVMNTVDAALPPAPESAAAPAAGAKPQIKPIKIIRKVEVQVLCPQHNPFRNEAKKANKLDRLRTNLLSLPEGARIKIRVSAGVFEVSLVRVVDANKTVEVLWDYGVKREFKWGSVVFGNTEGITVGQKPSTPAPEPQYAVATLAAGYPSKAPAFRAQMAKPPPAEHQVPYYAQAPPPPPPPYSAPTGVYSYASVAWANPHQQQYQAPAQVQQQQQRYGPTFSAFPRPYEYDAGYPHPPPLQQPQQQQESQSGQGGQRKLAPATAWHHYDPVTSGYGGASSNSSSGSRPRPGNEAPYYADQGSSNGNGRNGASHGTHGHPMPPAGPPNGAHFAQAHPPQQQQQQPQQPPMPTTSDLSALASLQAGQLDEILRGNPGLREALLGLISQHNAQQQA